ncbi:MAG TPA: nuclear transport factor 2 family protein [Thermoanaerobaculia bacterium]|nr:nuclear transport factor 2 family protein [Thermoanaerobaculia bacterium]
MMIGSLMLLLAVSLDADPAAEARQAEIDFAAAFAERDVEKFFRFVLDDAHFLGAEETYSGKASIREGWARFFEGDRAPFSWRPERVLVNDEGTLALSTGPIHNPEGALIGYYSSVWQKQPGGEWKVVFDGPGSAVPQPP